MFQFRILDCSLKPWRRGLLVATIAGPSLAGCAADRVLTTASIPSDHRARHAIALTQAPVTLDLIPAGGRLDDASRGRVRSFGDAYRNGGEGPISIQIPQGSAAASNATGFVNEIRKELASLGVKGSISVSTYRPEDPTLASPVRLSYVATKAVLRSRCGEWPSDLASGSSVRGWDNKPYWNHGCATQQALASQVVDPRDLAAPRGETPTDVTMRTRAIGKVREGQDPGTQWTVENTSIGAVGGN